MPVVDVKGIGTIEFPDGMSQDQIVRAIETEIVPQYKQHLEKTGPMAALSSGFTGALGSAATAVGETTGWEAAKKYGAERQKEAARTYEPTTAQDVAAAQGVLPTAKAMFYKQVAEPLAGVVGRYGVPTAAGMAAAAAAPETAAALTIARLAGFALPESQISAGENIQRQKEVSPNAPVNVAAAETAGVVQALVAGGLSLFGGTLAKPINSLFGKELTAQAAALAPKVVSGEITKDAALAAMEGPVKQFAKATLQNAATGAGMMVETEALRRAQAGQEVFSPEAQKVYLEQAKEAAELAPVFGAVHTPGQRAKATRMIEAAEQAKLPPEDVRVTQTPEALQAKAEEQQAEALRNATSTIGTTREELRAFGKQFSIGHTAKILAEDGPLAGRDISNPEDAAVVKQALEAYASGSRNVKAIPKIEEYLKRPEFQEQIPGEAVEGAPNVRSESTTEPTQPAAGVDERAVGSSVPSVGEGAGVAVRGGTGRVGEPERRGLGEAGSSTESAAGREEAVRASIGPEVPDTPQETAEPAALRDDGTPVKYVQQKDKPWYTAAKDTVTNALNSYQKYIDFLGIKVLSPQYSFDRKLQDAGIPTIDPVTNKASPQWVVLQHYNDSASVEAGLHHGGLEIKPSGLVEAYDIPGASREAIVAAKHAAIDEATKLAGGDAARGYDLYQSGMVAPRYEALKKRNEKGLSDTYLGDWTDSDAATAKKAQESIGPYLDNLRAKMNAQRNACIDFVKEAGAITKEEAEAYKQAWDYVPFHRVPEEALLDKAGKPVSSASTLIRIGKEYAIKGSDRTVNDVVENHFAKLDSLYRRGIRANAMNAVTEGMEKLGIGRWAKRPLTDVEKKKLNYVVLPNREGIRKEFIVDDRNDLAAFTNAPTASGVVMDILAMPTNILRQTVTLTPQFLYRQLQQDPARAVLVSGNNAGFIKTYKDAWTSAIRSLISKTPTVGADALNKAGVVGSIDFMDPKQIRKKYRGEDAGNLFTLGERLAQSSDLAAREAIYNNAVKEGVAKGMSKENAHAEGIIKAMAYMPYQQHGTSVRLAYVRRLVPFMNATIQGLARDVAAARGRLPGVTPAQGRKMLAMNLAKYAVFTAAYVALRTGDEDYENQPADNRDNNFYLGPLSVPAPQELRPLKTLVERGTRAWVMKAPQSDMTPEIGAAVLRKTWEIVSGMNPIPAAAKPIIEEVTNFNMFTGRPIVGRGLEQREPRLQFTDTTSELAKVVGNALNFSPVRIDHFLRGYLGYIGDIVQKTSNAMAGDRRAANYWDMMFLGTALDNPYGSGRKQDFYDLSDKVTRAKVSYKYLHDHGTPEEVQDYVEKNRGYLAMDKYVSDVQKTLTDLRKYKQNIDLRTDLTPDYKRNEYNRIAQKEAELLVNIRQMQKQAAAMNKG